MFIAKEDISPMMSGRTLFICPICKTKGVVFTAPSEICSTCKNNIPNVFRLKNDAEYRKDYHLGILKLLRVVK